MGLTHEALAKIVAGNVKAERKRAGISQNELAKMIGVTPRYVQRIESKPKNLSLRSLLKISTALKVPITSLLEGAQPGVAASKREVESLRLAVRVLQGHIDAADSKGKG